LSGAASVGGEKWFCEKWFLLAADGFATNGSKQKKAICTFDVLECGNPLKNVGPTFFY
jgi:hypothetical protein